MRLVPKAKADRVGFDVAKAIRSLHREAIKAGAFAKDDPRAASLAQTADAHLHGIGAQTCSERPCRLAGLCHALHELVDYQMEREGPLYDALILTDEVKSWLSTAGRRYAIALDQWIEYGDQQHAFERKLKTSTALHNHAELCERPRRILSNLQDLAKSLEDADLRAFFASHELVQASGKKRTALLLTAVWQHMDWGGIAYEEIFKLVPSDGPVSKPKDIVRKRITRAEARSLRPRELHPKLKPPRVDKRKRRVSPPDGARAVRKLKG
jgi:hypothetical protein